MTNIRNQYYYTSNGLTIKQLKEILNHLPEQNEYGEDYEIWMGTGNGLSNVVKSVCALNKRNDGCDVLLEI